MRWKKIYINKNNVKVNGYDNLLIQMPNKSVYAGYTFWYPVKLTDEGRHNASIGLIYKDSFTFRLKKYGKGRWNRRELIDSINIDTEKFEQAFSVIDGRDEYSTHDFHIPSKLEPEKEVKIHENLEEQL